MSTRGWSGLPPTSSDQARERLMDAAIACLQRYGLEKTAMSDIASAAGVTKPTLYNYFTSRDELITSALNRAARNLGKRLVEHARRFDTPADQVVEAVLFCLREIPNEPGLATTTHDQSDSFAARVALRPASLAIARHVLDEIFADRSSQLEDVDEIAEILIRWMLSLLTLDGPAPRDEHETRALLHRRMVPGLGLGSNLETH
ncbi:TetR/AcrR family transcriptional regulator [Myxococcota bacterium]|nr:TetR/AcrR family transcriptional regulator [Myxococcota bacterium]